MTKLRGVAAPFPGTLRRSTTDLETEEDLRAHLGAGRGAKWESRGPTPDAWPGWIMAEWRKPPSRCAANAAFSGSPIWSRLRYALRTLRRTPMAAGLAGDKERVDQRSIDLQTVVFTPMPKALYASVP
jgi:hypothetical protein